MSPRKSLREAARRSAARRGRRRSGAPWCRAYRSVDPRARQCQMLLWDETLARGADRPCAGLRGSLLLLAELRDHAPHPPHGFVQHRLDLVERDRVLAVAAAGGVV